MKNRKLLLCFIAALALAASAAFPALIAAAEDDPAPLPEAIELVPDGEAESLLFYEWGFSLPDIRLIVMEYSVGDSDSWTPHREVGDDTPEGDYLYGQYTKYYFSVDRMLLEADTDYYFRLRYEHLVSNAVHVNVSQQQLLSWMYELEYAYASDKVVVLPVGSDLTGLELPETVSCQYNWYRSTPCQVIWEDLSLADTSQAGWIHIRGEVIPPRGFYAPPDFAAYYPIMLVGDGMEPEAVEVTADAYRLIIIPVGTDPNTLPDTPTVLGSLLPDSCIYLTSNGLMGEFSISWDFSTVDTAAPGRYSIGYTTDLPVCFSAPDFTCTVVVMESDRIDLSGYAVKFNYQVFCHWLYRADSVEDNHLQYSIDSGPWQDTQAEYRDNYMHLKGDIVCDFSGTTLSIYYINIEYEEIAFRIVHKGQISGTLVISQIDGAVNVGYVEGDRGGADQGPQNPPVIEQPAPTPDYDGQDDRDFAKEPPPAKDPSPPPQDEPQPTTSPPPLSPPPEVPSGLEDAETDPSGYTPSALDEAVQDADSAASTTDTASEPPPKLTASAVSPTTSSPGDDALPGADSPPEEAMMEYSTDTMMSVSGLRLKEMMALDGDTMLLEKQGVSVCLSTGFLAGLEIGDSSRFTVVIQKGDNGFSLDILLDDIPLSALPVTAVYLPFTLSSGISSEYLACFNADGREVSAAIYDSALQVVRVEIQATGSYTVAPRVAEQATVAAVTVTAPAQPEKQADTEPGNRPAYAAVGIAAAALCAGYFLLHLRHVLREKRNG